MKQKLIVSAFAAIALSVVIVTTWPRSVRLIGTDKTSPVGLTVSIARSNTWDNSITDQNGIAGFGRGAWRLPWDSGMKIIAVYDDKNVYWEGVVKPELIGSIPVQLNDGRSKQVVEKTKPNKPAHDNP
jgi:hypothetical protein